MSEYDKVATMMTELGRNCLISVATLDGDRPSVRVVCGYYEDGDFYVVTYTLSNKMQQIAASPIVGVCGEWFSGHGVGENLGYVLDEKNAEIMARVREVFADWYTEGDVDESDPNTCLLRIRMTDGVLNTEKGRVVVDFANRTV